MNELPAKYIACNHTSLAQNTVEQMYAFCCIVTEAAGSGINIPSDLLVYLIHYYHNEILSNQGRLSLNGSCTDEE